MKSFRIFSAVALMGYLVFAPSAFAGIDNNASIVKLRDSANGGCVEAGTTINNCFDGSNAVAKLTAWISGTRLPNASRPLLVEVGPGTYPGIICRNWGYTTFRGAGRGQTIFTGILDSTINALKTTGCTELEFQNMTFSATGVSSAGVRWGPPGNSRWNNVELSGDAYGWYEVGVSATCGKHYWFNSKLIATGASSSPSQLAAYADKCGSENWFFSSELLAQATATQFDLFALMQKREADTHFYGSVIRALSSVLVSNGVTAISAQKGTVHIHGTGIDAISTAPGNSVVAITASPGATVHANGSAYNLSGGTGSTVTRIQENGGHVHAPYLWEHIPNPAVAPNFTSVDGADQATVTSGTSDGYPHTVVYSSKCVSTTSAAKPWWDAVDKLCR